MLFLLILFTWLNNRHPTTCNIIQLWSSTSTWRWIRRMDQSKDCVSVFEPMNECEVYMPFNLVSMCGYTLEWAPKTNWSYRMCECREDFSAYAEVCFREFGDRVLYWTTVNEPNVFVIGGYDLGFLPPGRCSFPFGKYKNCSEGNSATEPYLAMHHSILAHASAANLYRTKYKVGVVSLQTFLWKSYDTFVFF